MKSKNILLLLPATMLLASCGNEPGSSYKEVDKQTVAASAKKAKEEVSKDSFSVPKKLTLTTSASSSGTDKEASSVKGNFSVSVATDIENKYFHVSASGDASAEVGGANFGNETWVYSKDNSYVVATISGEAKSYMEIASSTEFDKEFKDFVDEIDIDEDSLKDTAKSLFDGIAEAASKYTGNISMEVNGTKVESSYKFYKGSGDGDIKMEYLSNYSSSNYSYSLEQKSVTASYLPSYVYSKKTGNFNGTAFSSEAKSTFDWDKCDLNYPDLSTFTKQNS